jgi:ATP-dependent DNA helicase RecG
MKTCLEKLYKFLKLETERGFDNHAVVGGLERMLDYWEGEARSEGIPEDVLQVVIARIKDYARLTPRSRAEALEGLWKRLQRSYPELPNLVIEMPGEAAVEPSVGTPPPAAAPAAPDYESPLSFNKRSKVIAPARKMPAPNEPAALYAPVSVLPGIGPRISQTLNQLGIQTLRDMLYHFPRRYEDYSLLKPINRLNFEEEVTVIGVIQSVSTRPIRGGKQKMVEAIVSDGTATLRVAWFNPWMAQKINPGDQIALSGKTEQYLGRLVMNNPEWELLDTQLLHTNRITPIYPLTANITQRWLRGQLNQVVTYWALRVLDPLPDEVRGAEGLMALPDALLQTHFPDSWDALHKAQERLAFDEIFLLQLGVLSQKRAWQERPGRIFEISDEWLQTQTQRLPFELTGAQHKALQDVCHDLASGRPMNRLIQGDVGSGKTIVAALASAIIASHSAQAAIMAPTSILAEQHYRNLLNILADNQAESAPASTELATNPLQGDQIRLMIGATPEAEKQEIRNGLAEGAIKLVIGTHALIEDPVTFADLQLVIVDEQHRFGVEQRSRLRAKGENPHLMVMTATPIPRSLALTIYGDLDLAVIDEMPPGRQPVSTHVLQPRLREHAYSLIRTQVQAGRQAFVVYPLVEESEASSSKAAVEEQTRLQNDIFPEFKVGLLHGRMRPDEKDQVMNQFRNGEYHILATTSVIEVGVDIPNATVMLIEGANRFGLAQLHQFRGRVGRGGEKSYCLLIPEADEQTENERLMAMTETNDGFVLAERDLQQRGPGQFLGTRQSGYAELQLASLTNITLIEKARRQAQLLFERDPDLSQEQHTLLAQAVERAWGGGQGDVS